MKKQRKLAIVDGVGRSGAARASWVMVERAVVQRLLDEVALLREVGRAARHYVEWHGGDGEAGDGERLWTDLRAALNAAHGEETP